MSTSLFGSPVTTDNNRVWLPGQGKYLARLRLTTLRDFVHALADATPQGPIHLDQATVLLQRVWIQTGLERMPGRSHAYRHLFALQLLGMVAPLGYGGGYALTSTGLELAREIVPGSALQESQRVLLAKRMMSPPSGMESPFRAFADLFGLGLDTPDQFVERGNDVILHKRNEHCLEVKTDDGLIVVEGRDAVDHLLWGPRWLFLQAELIDELPLTLPSRRWARTVFPIRRLEDAKLASATAEVASRIREALAGATRISIPQLTRDLRPAMRLTQADYQRVLSIIAKQCAGEFYFDRLSSSLISKREAAYVWIDGYWRASIVRY